MPDSGRTLATRNYHDEILQGVKLRNNCSGETVEKRVIATNKCYSSVLRTALLEATLFLITCFFTELTLDARRISLLGFYDEIRQGVELG